MPSLPNREILRAILSNPTAVRAERQRRRVRLGTDRDLLAFVEETFGVHIPAVACCPEHVAPAQAFCDAYFNRASVAVWKASRGFGGKSTLLALLALTEAITLKADVTVLGGLGPAVGTRAGGDDAPVAGAPCTLPPPRQSPRCAENPLRMGQHDHGLGRLPDRRARAAPAAPPDRRSR